MSNTLVAVMDKGGNINSVSFNTTTDFPVTLTNPGSDFSPMLLLLQILFRTKKFDQQPQQHLETVPSILWPPGNFAVHGQPNPNESKTTDEEHSDVSRIITKREVHEQAGEGERENQAQNSEEGSYLATAFSGMKDDEEGSCDSIRGLQPLPVPPTIRSWQHVPLMGTFGPGAKIVIRGRSKLDAPRLTFNLEYSNTIALHIDNRWTEPSANELVLNTYENEWGPQVLYKPAQINQGANFVVTIECLQKVFKICINDAFFTTYTHRVAPSMINQLSINNAAEIASIYYRVSS